MPPGRRSVLAGLAGLSSAGMLGYAQAETTNGQTLRAAMTGFTTINTLDPDKAAVNPSSSSSRASSTPW